MKIFKPIAYGIVLSAFLGSCTIAHSVIVTNNAVGSKTGEMKTGSGDADQGITFNQAMKNGRITKAGIAEFKAKSYVVIFKQYLTVTGE